eukprot:scaffold250563_cov31-Tisochrysis_lutea.AAC.2
MGRTTQNSEEACGDQSCRDESTVTGRKANLTNVQASLGVMADVQPYREAPSAWAEGPEAASAVVSRIVELRRMGKCERHRES